MVKNKGVRSSAAFAELFQRNVDAVYEAAWLVVNDREAAAGITQQTFIEGWSVFHRTPLELFDLWLLARARDRAFNWLMVNRPADLDLDGFVETAPASDAIGEGLDGLLRAQVVRALFRAHVPIRAEPVPETVPPQPTEPEVTDAPPPPPFDYEAAPPPPPPPFDDDDDPPPPPPPFDFDDVLPPSSFDVEDDDSSDDDSSPPFDDEEEDEAPYDEAADAEPYDVAASSWIDAEFAPEPALWPLTDPVEAIPKISIDLLPGVDRPAAAKTTAVPNPDLIPWYAEPEPIPPDPPDWSTPEATSPPDDDDDEDDDKSGSDHWDMTRHRLGGIAAGALLGLAVIVGVRMDDGERAAFRGEAADPTTTSHDGHETSTTAPSSTQPRATTQPTTPSTTARRTTTSPSTTAATTTAPRPAVINTFSATVTDNMMCSLNQGDPNTMFMRNLSLTWNTSDATRARLRMEGGPWIPVDVSSSGYAACGEPGVPWYLEVSNSSGATSTSAFPALPGSPAPGGPGPTIPT